MGVDSKAKMGRSAADAIEGGREGMSNAGRAISRGIRKSKQAVTGRDDDDEDEPENGRSRRGSDWR
jgi:hypothetical protein